MNQAQMNAHSLGDAVTKTINSKDETIRKLKHRIGQLENQNRRLLEELDHVRVMNEQSKADAGLWLTE